MTNQLLQNTLQAIFSLTRATQPVDASAIAHVIGTSPMRVAEALVVLEQRGWVDAGRMRLTMLGLAKAVAGGVPQARTTAGHTPVRRHESNASRRRGVSHPPARMPDSHRFPSELPIAAAPRVHH